MTSVFDENQLSEGRFISLLENFVTDDTNHVTVEQLVNFLHGGYVETEEEKMSRLARVQSKDTIVYKHGHNDINCPYHLPYIVYTQIL